MQYRIYHKDMVVHLYVHGYVFVEPTVLYNSNYNTDKRVVLLTLTLKLLADVGAVGHYLEFVLFLSVAIVVENLYY